MHLSSVSLTTRILQICGVAALLLGTSVVPAISAPVHSLARHGSHTPKINHPAGSGSALQAIQTQSLLATLGLAGGGQAGVGGPKPVLFKHDPAGSWQNYYQQRAYPTGHINWNDWTRALNHQRHMPPAGYGGQKPHIISGNWQFIGPTNYTDHYQWGYGSKAIVGRVNAVAYDPANANVLYAGSAGGGLWKSIDGGLHWAFLSLGPAWQELQVSSIAVGPNNTVYVGTGDFDGFGGETFGLLKSTDGGTSWINVGATQFGTLAVSRILIDPDHPNIVLVTTGRGQNTFGFVWRSTDSGATWTQVISAPNIWSDLKVSARSRGGNRHFYAASTFVAPSGQYLGGIWRSDDHGVTWRKLGTPSRYSSAINRHEIATSPTNSDTVYFASSFTDKVYRSLNAGATWDEISLALPTVDAVGQSIWVQAWYDFAMNVGTKVVNKVPQDLLYLSLEDIFQYDPVAGTWTVINHTYSGNDLVHTDQHAIEVSPFKPNELLVGNDGGIYKLTFDALHNAWVPTDLNATLGITQTYSISSAPLDPNIMAFGSQDNGSAVSYTLHDWRLVSGGDGATCIVDFDDPSIVYSSYVNMVVYRNGQNISPNIGTEPSDFVTPLAMDPNNSDLVYGATNVLYQWDDTLSGWTKPSTQKLSAAGYVQTIAVAYGDDNRIYTGSVDGQVWMTTDAGLNWTQINLTKSGGTDLLPNLAVTSISVNPQNPSDILVALSGNGFPHLWRCSNTLAQPPVWTSVSGSGASALPDISTNTIARDIYDPINTLYVGTDIGVFTTLDGGATWQNATQPLGLPPVQVNDLKAVAGTRYLNAGTYGLGIWRIPLDYHDQITTLTLNPSDAGGGATITGVVTLSGAARPGGVVVSLSSTNPSVAAVPASVTVPAGQTTATFTFKTAVVTQPVTLNVVATAKGVSATASLTLHPINLLSLTLSSYSVPAGATVTGTVNLNGPAPTGGIVVNVNTSDTTDTSVPTRVVVPGGATSATFNIFTRAVNTATVATITASYNGVTAKALLTLNPVVLATLTVNPASIVGGNTATGTITFSGPLPNPAVVTISAYNPIAVVATAPATITVPAGATSATFPISTIPVTLIFNVQVTVSYNGVTLTTILQVKPPEVITLSFAPTTVKGGSGTPVTGTVVLDAPAPPGGATILLTSTDTAGIVRFPASITIPVGQTTGTFPVVANAVAASTTITFTAQYNNLAAITGTLTVTP